MNQLFMRLYFPTPTTGMYSTCLIQKVSETSQYNIKYNIMREVPCVGFPTDWWSLSRMDLKRER